MRRVDLVVMGGGPAGAAAARRAAARGLSVLVVDKARFPRDKLCGGLLSGRTADQIARVYGAALEDGALFQRRHSFQFSWKGRVFSEAASDIPLHLTMRRNFDAWMLDQARAAGAMVAEGQRAEPGLSAQVLHLDDGTPIAWRALIGADGVNSQVAKALFGESFQRDRIGFCLEAEVPHAQSLRPPDAPILVDFGGIPWGYAWSFPKAQSVTLGLGAIESRAGDFKARMAALMAGHVRDPAAVTVKGHFIPFGHFRPVPGRGPVLLAGDAAGLVDPLTGEGIAYAIDSGARAADAVADWLAAGASADLVASYTASLAPIHAAITASNHLAATIHARFVPAALKQRLVADPRVQRKFFAILNGQAESTDVANFSLRDYLARRLQSAGPGEPG